MISVQSRGRLRQECSSIAPSVAPFVVPSVAPSVTLPDSSLLPKSGDKLSNQPVELSRTKSPIANALAAATNVLKYFKDNL